MKKHIELVVQLLARAVKRRTFSSERAQSLYEKGYLIGLLASLSFNDSYVYSTLKKKFNQLQ